MENHSLIKASRRTHGKIVLLAVAVSMIFVAAVSAFSVTKPDTGARAHGPIVKAKTTLEIEADVILPMLGFVSDLGPLGGWGLTLEKEEIVVNSMMETGRPGIYAAGDITTYPGKLKLIASGFAEAATAVNQAVHWIYPEKKVAPGHSSNMAIFGQKDD